MFNQYAQYPTVPGIIHTKDPFNQHLFTMWTDNIRSRIEYVDAQHKSGCPSNWSDHRKQVCLGVGRLVFEYIPMPNTDKETLRKLAETMDSESLSKQV
jgi:hypothetical protein